MKGRSWYIVLNLRRCFCFAVFQPPLPYMYHTGPLISCRPRFIITSQIKKRTCCTKVRVLKGKEHNKTLASDSINITMGPKQRKEARTRKPRSTQLALFDCNIRRLPTVSTESKFGMSVEQLVLSLNGDLLGSTCWAEDRCRPICQPC